MSLSGQYLVGPIDFQRGEFLPGPVDPAAVRMALILADGVFTADFIADNPIQENRVENLEQGARLIGFLVNEPVLRQNRGMLEVTIPDHHLIQVAQFFFFLRKAEDVEIVTRFRGEVVTSRVLNWLAERSRLKTLLQQ